MSLAEKEKPDNTTFWAILLGGFLLICTYFTLGGSIESILQGEIIEFPTTHNNFNSKHIVNMHGLTNSTFVDKLIAWYEGLGTGPAGTISKNLTLKLPNGEPYAITKFGVTKHFIDIRTSIGKNKIMQTIFNNFPSGVKKLIIDDNFINKLPFPKDQEARLNLLQTIITKASKNNVTIKLAIQPFNPDSAVQIGTQFEGNYEFSYQIPSTKNSDFIKKINSLIIEQDKNDITDRGSVIIYHKVNGISTSQIEMIEMTKYAREKGFKVQLF